MIIPVDLVLFELTRTSTSNQELLAPLIKEQFWFLLKGRILRRLNLNQTDD